MGKSNSKTSFTEFDAEAGTNIVRKKSLVKPERAKIDQNHPQYYYTQVANNEQDHINIQYSTTGARPIVNAGSVNGAGSSGSPRKLSRKSSRSPLGLDSSASRYISILSTDEAKIKGRGIAGEEDHSNSSIIEHEPLAACERKTIKLEKAKKSMLMSLWIGYCFFITFWVPPAVLRWFGMEKKAQVAWREKMGFISIILYLGAMMAFLVFGFTRTVCGSPKVKIRNNQVGNEFVVISGKVYESALLLQHPSGANATIPNNSLFREIMAGGKDATFLYQNVNGHCKGLIMPKENNTIPSFEDNLAWYMPCNLFNQDGSSTPNFNFKAFPGDACHITDGARQQFYSLSPVGDVYFAWHDVKNTSRKLVVYNGDVLDTALLNWIQYTDLDYPELFKSLSDDSNIHGQDISLLLASKPGKKYGKCLQEIIKVGSIDSKTIGCIASDTLLFILFIFILSIIFAKFFVACYYRWIVCPKQGASIENNKEMNRRMKAIEDWSKNISRQGPIKDVKASNRTKNVDKKFSKSRVFTRINSRLSSLSDVDHPTCIKDDTAREAVTAFTSMSLQVDAKSQSKNMNEINNAGINASTKGTKMNGTGSFMSNTIVAAPDSATYDSGYDERLFANSLATASIHNRVVKQPMATFQPFGFPLAHTLCLITCYSEDEEGLRTTLDSISTTDYPNSHKLIFVICDGIVKGSGNTKATSDFVIDMMTDLVVPEPDIEAHSYVSVAQGSKRHNKAKVYAGFYRYDDSTVPIEKQQRIPMITVVKCGTEAEQFAAKPGNRGKRDSQIILMSFLQKVTFNERMTRLDYEILLNIWCLTGLMADMYELVLMVDADTKVYPDSLTHMVATMVKDTEVMGLCGETKIANKAKSFITAIQVFEYFISYHQAKAFESVFGCVTCLPGCFSMYRIKAPKGRNGFWVPILANPDIVERYSDNVVETLHKKNLLLLGEDRFLSTLMLKTFPKRKQIFVAKAACKTVVPETFMVLLSQRRRWINSTVHNLMELVLVKDLCGTFCFSMQFVILIESIGTLVLPAAIAFTFYVIIFAIVSESKPVMSLVLLAIIFGLPALLIAITATGVSYFVWMLIYLFALPIWNFVLPTYAYWKFDDFSWGETRKVADDKAHDNIDGDFDATHIVMKRWAEFEADRILDGVSLPQKTWDPTQSNVDQIDQLLELKDRQNNIC